MINLPQSVFRDCLAVFRRILPKPFLARAATPISVSSSRDGIRLQLVHCDICVEFHHPSPSEKLEFAIPISALVDCEGRGAGVVRLQPIKNVKVELHWEQAGAPCVREYAVPDTRHSPFPAWPSRDTANDPSLLAALDEAMQIPTGSIGRLSLSRIQLRGKEGDIVATDGRQLLVQGGFQFPWNESLLVSRTPVFAAKELPKGEVVRVARTKTHVLIRIGAWTIALCIDPATSFPKVDSVIPRESDVKTRWHIAETEAPVLAKMLDKLPAAKEEYAPVTIDLARTPAIRARAEDEKRCTDLAVPSSQLEGKTTRLATDRRYLQKAMELGFCSILITSSDKPIMCKDDKRLYVWVPIDSKSALPPQANPIRLTLPGQADDACTSSPQPVRRRSVGRESVRRPAPGKPTPSARPVGVFDGLVNCVRGLWGLVDKHRQKERMK
jgi:hypothetical protein